MKYTMLAIALVFVSALIYVVTFPFSSPTYDSVTESTSDLLPEPANPVVPEIVNGQMTNDVAVDVSAQTSNDNKVAPLAVIAPIEWQFDEPLARHILLLKKAVQQGDVEASFILAKNLRFCYHVPKTEQDYETKLSELLEFSDADRAAEQLTMRFEYCRGVETSDTERFFDYLEYAVVNGSVFAQEEMAKLRQDFYMKSQGFSQLERGAFIEKRDAFLAQRHDALRGAAMHGSLKAIETLARMNATQELGANTVAQAFAYNGLMLSLTDDNEIFNRYTWFQNKLIEQMTPEEEAVAYSLLEEWKATIYQNGTLYTR